jgi:hypothetical protein
MMHDRRKIRSAGETEAGSVGKQPARDSRPGLRPQVDAEIQLHQSRWIPAPLAACERSSPMPQKIHPWNMKNRPTVGRISILAELGSRPIQAEPVQNYCPPKGTEMRSVVIKIAILWLVGISSAMAKDLPSFALAGFTGTKGGTEGEVIRVTNLNTDGPGSLRAAIAAKGKRLVVFEVSGVIDLQRKSLEISEPHLTIAGQTAPSPGITLVKAGVYVQTHDVIIQHIRSRPGDKGKGLRMGSDSQPDALSTFGGSAHDIIVDHCSLTWATDENLSASGPRLEGPEATSRRITFSNNIIAECLLPHSKGSLIHDFCQDIAIIANLYAHNHERNPYFKAHTTGVIVNNVIYNPGAHAIQLGYAAGEWGGSKYKPVNCRVSVVGNVLFHGTNTKKGLPLITRPGDVYMHDNLAYDTNGA